MHITQDSAPGNEIKAYDDHSITVNEATYTRNLLVTEDTLITDVAITFDLAQCQALLDYDVEIIIVGTGQRQQFPETDIINFFLTRGIGFEVMDTAAACRTYNVLHNEGRRVLALLVIN